ncbi:MAG: aldose 1-epimerase [Alphaproteobacteria bacterium]|nr:aldose 1-epimerase [Alphaproteobacteria bacterium]
MKRAAALRESNRMTNQQLVRLSRGRLALWLAPAIGGSIARFEHRAAAGEWVPILRGVEGVPANALDAGSFPLVPYCNRIRNGRFTFRGREVWIRPNMANDPNPLHGDGWQAAWEVAAQSDDQAELVYRHAPGEWPWAYEARQHFRLDEDGLDLRLSCRNLADEPMPCGLGQHPYFRCTPATRLDTKVGDVWTIDEQVLPVERLPATGRYDLADRPICGQHLDNGFDGWSGEARIRTPGDESDIILSSPDAGYFQVYSPIEGGIFVAEPVTHANAALNEPEEHWPSLGLRVLASGEEMALNARIALVRSA